METCRVNRHQAAQELGMSVPRMYELMRRGVLDIGAAISPKKSGKANWKFYVYRDKLDRYLGKELRGEDRNCMPKQA